MKEEITMVRIGVDVGGTGIQVGIVNDSNQITAQDSIVTRPDLPFTEQIRQMAECILSLVQSNGLQEQDIQHVGVGIPGIASPEGVVIKCANLGWNHVPFREEFNRVLNRPVYLDNDANVAALAESVIGISAGTSSSVFITLGTGIGSGIILNGKIWSGFHGIGGELGHTILALDGLPCNCGNHGCLERYCSATAIIRMEREAVATHPESTILSKAGGNPDRINAKYVTDAAREKDPVAMEVFARFIRYLSQAVANVVNFLDPEMIGLGGGVSKAGAILLDGVREEYWKYVNYRDQPMPPVHLAILGPEAGIIGAAMLG